MSKRMFLIIICLIGLIILGVYSYKRFISNRAAQLTSEIYAVWAAQGPFNNGKESAKAMKYAHASVRGLDVINEPIFIDAIKKHMEAYDADSNRWESLRQESLSFAKGKVFEERLALARRYTASEADIDNTITQK